jgi:hypothetical protein
MSTAASRSAKGETPRVTGMRVIPVAGRDSMLLNLRGAVLLGVAALLIVILVSPRFVKVRQEQL